jgi:segregation and condensation protein B
MQSVKLIIEAALMCADEPLDLNSLRQLFPDDENKPSPKDLRDAITELEQDYSDRAVALIEVASGYCFRVRQNYATHVQKLWQERSPRYSRALLETLALIAYKQPITRAEVEDVRGVSVSTSILKTLTERQWIQIVGYKEVPGKPALYATTKEFLDYFNLKSLAELPTLNELENFEKIEETIQIEMQPQLEIAEENSSLLPVEE